MERTTSRFRVEQTPASRAHQLKWALASITFADASTMVAVGKRTFPMSHWLSIVVLVVQLSVLALVCILGFTRSTQRERSTPNLQLLKTCIVVLAVALLGNIIFLMLYPMPR